MALVPVNVYCVDTATIPLAIAGATVAVFDATGTTLLSQVVSDGAGLAAFLLDDGGLAGFADYRLRFFKTGVAWPNNYAIRVLPSPGANGFTVAGALRTPPVVIDPRLCVAYGVFRDGSGRPARGVNIAFMPRFSPLMLEGSPILVERVDARTDTDGYVELPLIRCGEYDVVVEGLEDITRVIAVPDAANIPIGDLIFPVVSAIAFSPSGAVSLAVGAEVTLTPTVVASDGRTLTGAAVDDVDWAVADPTLASVSLTATTVTVRGLAAGATTLLATRRDTTIVSIPTVPISGVPLAVTVTP